MTGTKLPAKIDFGGLTDIGHTRLPKVDPITSRAAIEDAKAAGFTTRAPETHLDGRSLRKTGRTAQLNIKLKPETKAAFLTAAAAFANTEDFVVHLLKLAGSR